MPHKRLIFLTYACVPGGASIAGLLYEYVGYWGGWPHAPWGDPRLMVGCGLIVLFGLALTAAFVAAALESSDAPARHRPGLQGISHDALSPSRRES